jgi:sulfite exporter TauE/SafE/copper chaperone CopZ
MSKLIVPIKGIRCRSCELLVEEQLKSIPGVTDVCVSQTRGQATIEHGADIPSRSDIEAAVKKAGYAIGKDESAPWLSRDIGDWRTLGLAALILLGLYVLADAARLTRMSVPTESAGPAVALVVGLVAGVSTCMALVGGLVLGLSARHAALHPEATGRQKFVPHLWFNFGRVAGFALLGGLLGSVGGILKVSPGSLAVLTAIVGALMVMLGLKLVGVSPRLKKTQITLPAGLTRRLGLHHAGGYNPRAAVTTGALTFFLPCGFTQAMQVAAVASGSFGGGAAVMALFALGTAPTLLGVGGLTSIMRGASSRLFLATAGLAVLVFGIMGVRGGLTVLGLRLTGNRPPVATSAPLIEYETETQVIRVTQKDNGYFPNSLTVRRGLPVRLIVTSETAYSCAASLVMPTLGISRDLHRGENVIEFTPTAAGTIPFSCAMGMYRGVITVI